MKFKYFDYHQWFTIYKSNHPTEVPSTHIRDHSIPALSAKQLKDRHQWQAKIRHILRDHSIRQISDQQVDELIESLAIPCLLHYYQHGIQDLNFTRYFIDYGHFRRELCDAWHHCQDQLIQLQAALCDRALKRLQVATPQYAQNHSLEMSDHQWLSYQNFFQHFANEHQQKIFNQYFSLEGKHYPLTIIMQDKGPKIIPVQMQAYIPKAIPWYARLFPKIFNGWWLLYNLFDNCGMQHFHYKHATEIDYHINWFCAHHHVTEKFIQQQQKQLFTELMSTQTHLKSLHWWQWETKVILKNYQHHLQQLSHQLIEREIDGVQQLLTDWKQHYLLQAHCQIQTLQWGQQLSQKIDAIQQKIAQFADNQADLLEQTLQQQQQLLFLCALGKLAEGHILNETEQHAFIQQLNQEPCQTLVCYDTVITAILQPVNPSLKQPTGNHRIIALLKNHVAQYKNHPKLALTFATELASVINNHHIMTTHSFALLSDKISQYQWEKISDHPVIIELTQVIYKTLLKHLDTDLYLLDNQAFSHQINYLHLLAHFLQRLPHSTKLNRLSNTVYKLHQRHLDYILQERDQAIAKHSNTNHVLHTDPIPSSEKLSKIQQYEQLLISLSRIANPDNKAIIKNINLLKFNRQNNLWNMHQTLCMDARIEHNIRRIKKILKKQLQELTGMTSTPQTLDEFEQSFYQAKQEQDPIKQYGMFEQLSQNIETELLTLNNSDSEPPCTHILAARAG